MAHQKKLGAKARRIIDYAAPGTLGIPAAVVIELGVQRSSDFFAPFFAQCPQIPVSINAAIRAPVLRLPHTDPYDRLIVATALDLGVPLITKDGNITDSGIVQVVL